MRSDPPTIRSRRANQRATNQSGERAITRSAPVARSVHGFVGPFARSLEHFSATCARKKGIAAHEHRVSRRTRDRTTFLFRSQWTVLCRSSLCLRDCQSYSFHTWLYSAHPSDSTWNRESRHNWSNTWLHLALFSHSSWFGMSRESLVWHCRHLGNRGMPSYLSHMRDRGDSSFHRERSASWEWHLFL